MLRHGASLAEIGEILRHRHLQTTTIYTKVDVDGVTHARVALAGRCAMTPLRQAVHEYLRMRRALGFKLQDAGKGLLAFVAFLEQQRAPVITQALALTWAQQPARVQPAYWARRLSYVRAFAHYRRATDPRTEVPAPHLLPFQPQRARPYLYSALKFAGSCVPRSICPVGMSAGGYACWRRFETGPSGRWLSGPEPPVGTAGVAGPRWVVG